ncbi:MAG TPA: NmrA family NAD(P)-binding protein, partial [Myxococcota bacterium]|nr:NmrA family NAD(P)-binding protein [Myxococcota bacterium]
ETDIEGNRTQLSAAILGAVADARPGHVVLLSSIGANHPSGTGPIQFIHPIENGLRETGIPSTFLRAGFFMENWAAMAQGAIDAGTLYYGMRTDAKLPQVATPDIGRTAARLLLDGAPAGGVRIVQLAGPADLTLQETADVLGKIAGKPITAVTVPREATVGAFLGMGASRAIGEMYAELTIAFNDGQLVWEPGEVVRGTVTLEQRLRELLGK